ncbi:ste ste7 protein kinase [Diplodia corticola]|uniref:mitogen-activated protein kinase kinase n=1 Tax=Diplodia corticola TaxID=236234 RepID=A0A1J9RQE0_9PEZI|nr:ste ste7 protein kinase [Diplodia corticola]OJD30116.1 ste ste7 protein kinase [Diplodia corticola]
MAASTPDEDQLSDVSSPLESPTSPDLPSPSSPPSQPPLSRSASAAPSTSGMTVSSTPLGNLSAARHPSKPSGTNLPQDILERMKAVHMGRQRAPPPNPMRTPTSGAGAPLPPQSPGGAFMGGVPRNFQLPGQAGKPAIGHFPSAPAVPNLAGLKKPSLAEKRGMALPGGLPGAAPNGSPAPGGRKKPGLTLSDMKPPPGADAGGQNPGAKPNGGSLMDEYAKYLDKETGNLKFDGRAVLTAHGVKFASGSTFNISLDETETLDELGKGNYGTVYKVRHARPQMRRPGLGLAGNKAMSMPAIHGSPANKTSDESDESSPTAAQPTSGPTGRIMAMKEIRLELDDAKFAAIIMELDILHRCVSPYIIDFYGAFFQDGAVYICMEFMNGGSIDKLYGEGIPENVLRKITLATTMGLKSLKDEHNIIHRDVKPTNILINNRGQVKICDFGVSGNLVASIAKTNIGCQSYMAPERISSGGVAQAGANPGGGTYSVQSDIWSLGLTIIECAMGRYPYPPETYNNIFSQLSAIVDGEPPDLPAEGFSDAARNFVSGCLNKIPNLRPTYAMLLQHAWLAPLLKPETIAEEDEEEAEDGSAAAPPVDYTGKTAPEDPEVAQWVLDALEKKRTGKLAQSLKPALHAAPLDAVSSPQGTPSAEPDAPPPPPANEE